MFSVSGLLRGISLAVYCRHIFVFVFWFIRSLVDPTLTAFIVYRMRSLAVSRFSYFMLGGKIKLVNLSDILVLPIHYSKRLVVLPIHHSVSVCG